jgi:hypothetical protein
MQNVILNLNLRIFIRTFLTSTFLKTHLISATYKFM